MAVTKEVVLAGLDAVPSPDGTPLPRTGKLSDIVVSDGKVFFSITVDAAVVQAWEPVRKAAEAVVRGVPTRCWRCIPGSLAEVLERGRAAGGDRPFIVLGDERLTHEVHYQQVVAMAGRLADEVGVAKGDRVAIASYLGRGGSFDHAIVEFSGAYAGQNERDYKALEDAVKAGTIEAKTGL